MKYHTIEKQDLGELGQFFILDFKGDIHSFLEVKNSATDRITLDGKLSFFPSPSQKENTYLDYLFEQINQQKTPHQCFIVDYENHHFWKIDFLTRSYTGDPEEAYLREIRIMSITDNDKVWIYLKSYCEKKHLENQIQALLNKNKSLAIKV
jgi:hypothetical protein